MSAAEVPLEEFLVEPFAPDNDEPAETPWRIDGIGTAEWVAAKLRRAKREIAAAQAEYEAWKTRADEWLAAKVKPHEHDIQWAEAQLCEWMRLQREADDDCKTITLPSGTVLRSVAHPATPKVVDDAKFLAWANEAWPDLVRKGKDSPDMAAIKRALRETGEVLPGVEIAEAHITYSVEAGE